MGTMIKFEGVYEDWPFYGVANSIANSTLGVSCSANTLNMIGQFLLIGVKYKGKTTGDPDAKIPSWSGGVKHVPIDKLGLPAEVIRNAVWEQIVKVQCKDRGVCVFADRITRNTKSNTHDGYSVYDLDGLRLTTAAFGKWLQGRLDLGICVASPVYENPNYMEKNRWSMCRVWTFIPSGRMVYYKNDNPDLSHLTQEKFFEEWGKKFNETKPEEWVNETYQ